MSSDKTGNLTNNNKIYVRCHRELNQQNFGYGYNPLYDRTNLYIINIYSIYLYTFFFCFIKKTLEINVIHITVTQNLQHDIVSVRVCRNVPRHSHHNTFTWNIMKHMDLSWGDHISDKSRYSWDVCWYSICFIGIYGYRLQPWNMGGANVSWWLTIIWDSGLWWVSGDLASNVNFGKELGLVRTILMKNQRNWFFKLRFDQKVRELPPRRCKMLPSHAFPMIYDTHVAFWVGYIILIYTSPPNTISLYHHIIHICILYPHLKCYISPYIPTKYSHFCGFCQLYLHRRLGLHEIHRRLTLRKAMAEATWRKSWPQPGSGRRLGGSEILDEWRENHSKIMGKSWKIMEKNMENHGKCRENHGKTWKNMENYGKSWKIMENMEQNHL